MSDDRFLRAATSAAVLLVAVIAAVVSFVHIEHLAITHGQTVLASLLMPLSIDGTVAAASLVMFRAARAGLSPPALARIGLAVSVAATLGANVAYGLPFGAIGALISGWSGVAFVICAEMAIGMVRRSTATVSSDEPQTAPQTVPGARPLARVPAAPEADGIAHLREHSATAPGRARARSQRHPKARSLATAEHAERHYAAELLSGSIPSLRSIKEELRCGTDRARALRAHLAGVLDRPADLVSIGS